MNSVKKKLLALALSIGMIGSNFASVAGSLMAYADEELPAEEQAVENQIEETEGTEGTTEGVEAASQEVTEVTEESEQSDAAVLLSEEPEFDAGVLKVQAVDKDGNPIAGAQLIIKPDWGDALYFDDVTDEDGIAQFTCANAGYISSWSEYTIEFDADDDNERISDDIYVGFEKVDGNWTIGSINWDDFDGSVQTIVGGVSDYMPDEAWAEDMYEYYPNIYNTEKAVFPSMPVYDKETGELVEDEVKVVFYDTNLQEYAEEVTTVDGMVPELELTKLHTYLVTVESKDYTMDRLYFMLDNKGRQIYPFKLDRDTWSGEKVERVKSLQLEKRETPVEDPRDDNKIEVKIPVYAWDSEIFTTFNRTEYDYMLMKDAGYFRGAKFKFVSQYETVEGEVDENNMIVARLTEDMDYMLILDEFEDYYGTYTSAPIPVAVKFHEMFGEDHARDPYNHTNCNGASVVMTLSSTGQVIKCESFPHNYEYRNLNEGRAVITSEQGNVKLSGMSIHAIDQDATEDDYDHPPIVNERVIDKEISELDGKEYSVLDIDMINMHRGELLKFAAGDYTYDVKVPEGKIVSNVYKVGSNDELEALNYTQNGSSLTFSMDTISINDIAIEYADLTMKTTSKAYNGKVQKPAISIVSGSKKFAEGSDYTVKWNAVCKNIGTYTGSIKFANGEVKNAVKYTITKVKPAGSYITKASSLKGALGVYWKSQTAKVLGNRISGYQIEYSKSAKFSNSKKINVKGYKATYKKIKYLKKNTTYYVRVRTYINLGGAVNYSSWSKAKKVKTK